jgi:hypothetical protein
MMNKYYIYAYLREDKSPYYIGKGKNRRAYEKHFGFYPPEDRSRIIFLNQDLDEMTAFALERFWIRIYGRKDLEEGILHNKTDGGEGASGFIMSTEQRIAISNQNKGEGNGMFGKSHTEKAKKNISQGHMGIRLSAEHKEAVGRAHRGKKLSEEHKSKCSAKLSGKNNPNYGKKISEEQKAKFRATMAAKKSKV